jgi:hypothetical protein
MAPRGPLLFGAALVALTLGGVGLVSAQQGDAPVAVPIAPVDHLPAAAPAAKPAAASSAAPVSAATDTVPTPPDATDAEADDSDDAAPSSAPHLVEPAKRPRYAIAVMQALDKVSAETLRFEVPINQPVRYQSLIFIVRACETNAPDEPVREAAAHVEIISQPTGPDGGAAPPGRRVFRGWMYANAPGVDLLQHPVYDAWLIACKTAAPST